MDKRFTLFSEALITSKETFNLVLGEYGAVNWGCDYDDATNSEAFKRDLSIRGHTDEDEIYMREWLHLLGIQEFNYLKCLYQIVNRGSVYCPDDIQGVVDYGISFSVIYCREYF